MIAYLNDSVISILTRDVSVTPRWGEKGIASNCLSLDK